jgi:hypothetical protein
MSELIREFNSAMFTNALKGSFIESWSYVSAEVDVRYNLILYSSTQAATKEFGGVHNIHFLIDT